MPDLQTLRTADLRDYCARVNERYHAFRAQALSLNLGRGKPSPEQLDLSNGLLGVLGPGDVFAARRHRLPQVRRSPGLPEARDLFGQMLGAGAIGSLLPATRRWS
jgi:hypothetical protein